MEINGIKIRDMKDVQDVLMALETIKNEFENLSDSMSDNYTNYNSLNEDISNSVYSQKELIEGISQLQIRAQDIIGNIDTLNNDTKTIKNNTITIIKNEFENFDYKIQQTMSSVVNSIDLKTFRKQVETLFFDKISSLESEVRRLSNNNDGLEELNNKIKTTINNTKDDIEDSINEFNRLSKVVNWKVIISVLFAGIFVGASLVGGILFYQDRILFEDKAIVVYHKNLLNTKKMNKNNKYTFKYQKYFKEDIEASLFKEN